MIPTIPPSELQQAWQTAFHLRTCPDDTTLRMSAPDEHLLRHLAVCAICREKRAMPDEQVNAWQGLFDKFAQQIHHAVNAPQPGQVWVLKKNLARWGNDGYFYSPPNVMLLEKLDDKHGFRVAQIYSDKRLMGEGDVWLGDKLGFAQGWNSYTLHQNALDCWLGSTTESQFAEVIQAGAISVPPVEEHSILSSFRKLEITVGSSVSIPSVAALLDELGIAQQESYELIPGLKLAVSGTKNFVLDIATGTLDALRNTFKPTLVLRGGAPAAGTDKLMDEQKKLLLEHCHVIPVDMKIIDDTLTMTLMWPKGRPAHLPAISVLLNEVEVFDGEFFNNNAEKFTIKHPSLSTVTVSEIAGLKVSLLGNKLFFRIFLVK